MFQVKKKKELEGFGKNRKRNTIIIASILGILIVVGIVTLFRTFAFFEEKREFNVIRGRIPDFSKEDIQLAFTIDGVKGTVFPSKDSDYVGKTVTCEKGATAVWNNELWGIVDVNSNGNAKITCSVAFVTEKNFYKEAKIGDYVSYTPTKTDYSAFSNLTGYSNEQSINPSELKVWRVIRKNADGSVDLVSENVSSKEIYFYGREGYNNYVGALNMIAKGYETAGITSGSRYMGYDEQTEFIEDASFFSESTTAENSPKGSEREKQGGGDFLHVTDQNLVRQACGTLEAFPVGKSSDDRYSYFLAGRYYQYDWQPATGDSENYRYIKNQTVYDDDYGFPVYTYTGSTGESEAQDYVRPIVTLKSGLIVNSGNGLSNNPWKVN